MAEAVRPATTATIGSSISQLSLVQQQRNSASSRQHPPTTTISTIAVQSGTTRIVVALLQSKEWLQLQVLEMSPDMTRMGDSFIAASDLLMAHQDVLKKLQSKQSPVEELLKQADQLIATQRPRAEVYAAMAESLGQAWKDLNNFLEQRRVILEYNVSFHSHGEDVIDKLMSLDKESTSTTLLPNDFESVKRLRTRLDDSRKSTLESLRLALLDGEVLTEKLTAMKNLGSLDSRPGHIISSVSAALNQVKRWLEALHDRRHRSESVFQKRRATLDQWMEVCALRRDLTATNKRLEVLGRNGNSALGDSSATAEMLLFEHNKLQPDCKDLQEKTLKLTHQAEELQNRWRQDLFIPIGLDGAADQVRSEAYNLLDKSNEFLETVEQRGQLLSQSIQFFRVATAALTKLDQLEVQLAAHQAPPGSSQLAQLHSQVARALEDATAPALHHGYSLLEQAGRSHPGTEGIKRTVEQIENRGILLGSLCTAHKEESLRITQAVRSFIEQYEHLQSWLLEVVEAFMRSHTDMRGTLPEAREVLDMHSQVLNDLTMKGTEIDALLRSVNSLCEMAEEVQAHEVQMKGDLLHDTWQKLRRALAERVELMQTYVRLHGLALQVQGAWDNVEAKCQELSVTNDDQQDPSVIIRQVEELWLDGQQKFLQLNQLGRNFMADAIKISDRHLDVRKACLCVESLLEYLGGRQLTVHQMQETWIETVTTIRQTRHEWTQFITIIKSVMEVHKEKERSLYPMLPFIQPRPSCSNMISLLEDKSKRVAAEIAATLSQLESRKMEADQMKLTSGANQEERSKMLGELSLLQQRMHYRLKEYSILVQMTLGLFRNLTEVETMVDILQRKSDCGIVYHSIAEVDMAAKDHQVTRNTIAELIKITRQEAAQIVALLQDQEPVGVTQPDVELIDWYLQHAEKQWEKSWQAEEGRLARQRQRCQFNADLHAINIQLDELSRQLAAMRGGQYGSSLAAARVTSQAFLQFEKTIELLEIRIGTFFSTAQQLMNEEKGDRAFLEGEMSQIDRKWSSFHTEVGETRKRIDLSLEYFALVEEVEHSFRQGSQLLVTVARKSTQVRTPAEARQLLQEVETFIKPQEEKLDNRIRKISELAVQLYGIESSQHIQSVLNDGRSMMNSFSVINTELSTLAINLKAVDEERLKQAQTQAQVQESLEAARAEAAAAKAAAAAAEVARKAAEAAALAMKEDWAINLAAQQQQVPPRPPLPASLPELPRPSAAALAGRAPTPPKRLKPTDVDIEGPIFTSALNDATVEEGKTVKFTCRVSGQPTPSIIWLKDGMSIANNPDYQTAFDEHDGTCSLSIDETFADDSARFTCQASNAVGFAQTSATLTVQENAEDRLVAPEFVEPLLDSKAREGQPHQLNCRVSGIPPPIVSWYKNGVCLDSNRDYATLFDSSSGLCTLSLAHVFVEDGATFECRASNEAGDADTAAQLTVEPLEPTEIPLFNPGLSSNVMARTGQRVRLECTVSAGLPKPTVHWLHNNKPIKETRDIKTLVEGDNKYLLTITEAFPKDAGTYTAVARNVAGEATTTCCLAVKGRLPTETSDSELASDMEPIKPSIQQPLPANLSVCEGDKVRLDCVIVAQPEPEVIWYQNDRPVKESSDFQLVFQGDRCSLLIREIFQEDSGTYRVVAVNSAGEASSQCQLAVTPLEEPVKEVESVALLVSRPSFPVDPPVFTQIFGNGTADVGGRLVFDCIINGCPVPNVKWYHNDVIIGPGLKGTGENEYQLVIENVQVEQAGRYKCVAENEAGVATCTAHLVVQQPADKQLDISEESFFSRKAVFSQSSTAFTSQENSFRSVSRQVEKSITKVTGQTAQEVRTEQTEQINQEGEGPILSVKQRATMFTGGPTTSTTTEQTIKPIKVTQQQRKQVAPRFVSPLTGAMVEQGVDIQLEAILDGHPTPDVKWYKNGIDFIIPPNEESGNRIELTFAGQKARLAIKNVQESDAGRYTCTARNAAGTASSTADVVVRRTQFPPVFGRRLQAQTVRHGSRVTFEVEVTGTPVPDVYWSKDGRPLEESNNVSIKVDTNQRHRMVIAKVSQLDAGRYTVKASNRAGEAISTAELIVSAAALTSASEAEQSSPSMSRKHPPLKVDVTARPAAQVDLKPEPAPELLFAPKSSETPKSGASSSSGRIDFAEKTRLLEEASKVISPTEVPGGIRLLPMPSPLVEESKVSTIVRIQQHQKQLEIETAEKRRPSVELSKFEPFPELEPFPFKPDPPRVTERKKSGVLVRKPNKFVKGDSRESDYESDLEGAKILPRWAPPGSDTEDAGYKKVQPKLATSEGYSERSSRAVSKEPTPPSQFDVPPEMDGPPRPVVLTEATVAALIEAKMEAAAAVVARPLSVPTVSVAAPSLLKPSSRALEMEKQWVPSKRTLVEDRVEVMSVSSTPQAQQGRTKPSQKALEMEKQWSHKFAVSGSKIWPPPCVSDPPSRPSSTPIWAGQSISSSSSEYLVTETKQVTTAVSGKKSILKSREQVSEGTVHQVQQQQQERVQASCDVAIKPLDQEQQQQREPLVLEPFPFKPDPPSQQEPTVKTALPLRKPGRFVPGEFSRESDYESDLESVRIAPRWVPPDSDQDEPTYRKVQPPPPTPIELRKQPDFVQDKVPSPPSKYDANPPQFDGPPRPVFQPLDLSDQRPIPTQPLQQQQRKPSVTGVETTRRMQMEESTQFSKRFVTVEQTTKYVQLTSSELQQQPQQQPTAAAVESFPVLEPFPFIPDPVQPVSGSASSVVSRSAAALSFRPSKFIPGEGRTESDYESDYDGARIRPRWTPAGSETDEPRYRRVVTAPTTPAGTLKRTTTRTPTPPTVFDQPPTFQGPPRPVISPTDAIKIKSALHQMSSDFASSSSVIVKPKAIRPTPATVPSSYYVNQNRPILGQQRPIVASSGGVSTTTTLPQQEQRPTYGYAEPPPAASVAQEKAASHFNQMSTAFRNKAQQFAQQVISDVRPSVGSNIQAPPPADTNHQQQQSIPAIVAEPPAPSIDSAAGGGGGAEPQAYHEESRLSEYGTKHIDPDTGLIYFKYDFGYEFGLVLPGQPQKVDKIETTIGKEGTIELPVIHEHTTPAPSPTPLASAAAATAEAPATPKQQPQQPAAPVTFRPRKFTQFKAAKWEPTTDSELSDQEASSGNNKPSQPHQHGRYYGERKQTFKSNSGNKLTAGSGGSHSAAASAEERSPSPQSMCSISPSPEPTAVAAGGGEEEQKKKL